MADGYGSVVSPSQPQNPGGHRPRGALPTTPPPDAVLPTRGPDAPAPGQPIPLHYRWCLGCGSDEPAGLHLYHCHSTPLKDHIAHGLYGMYIVDPKEGRAPAHELVMMLNSFDTNFDEENEVYAANTKAFYYMERPIKVKKGELVRIYAANIVEFDQINSLHVHGNFFDEYRTGTMPAPNAYTDIIELGQGERSVLELRFNDTGRFMFHAHQTEFTEKGWVGAFEVEE